MSDNLTIFSADYTNVTGIKAKGTGNGTLTYIRPAGTKSITANGTGIDVTSYASVDVAVEGELDVPVFTGTYDESTGTTTIACDKTYAECLQLALDGTYYAVARMRNDNGLCLAGFDYGPDFGDPDLRYYGMTHGIPTIVVTYKADGSITSGDPDTVKQLAVTENGTYTASSYEVWNEVTVNVPSSTPTLQSKTATPTEQQQTVSPDSGYDGLSSVTVGAISSTYVGSGITQRTSSDLAGSLQTSTYDVTAPAGYYDSSVTFSIPRRSASNITTSISNGYLLLQYDQGYYPGGGKNLAQARTQTDLTVSGDTVTVPAGYYSEQTSKAVAAGSMGTPVITKGTPSRGEVSIRASVTNTAGYISGGTLETDAVRVDASELVSGTTTITENGTYDVTYWESADVAIPIVNYSVNSAAPTSSQGSDGDIWLVV